jgi:hydrogenase nickel incorporation protein HypA/HybF
VHEKVLMDDLIWKIESEARREGAGRVTRIHVRLGALSHFTAGHFREHFEDASRGTLAEGAEVEAELRDDPTEPDAQGVVLESIEVSFRGRPPLRRTVQ